MNCSEAARAQLADAADLFDISAAFLSLRAAAAAADIAALNAVANIAADAEMRIKFVVRVQGMPLTRKHDDIEEWLQKRRVGIHQLSLIIRGVTDVMFTSRGDALRALRVLHDCVLRGSRRLTEASWQPSAF